MTVSKLEYFQNLKPQLITYDYLKVVKESKKDGFTIYKQAKGRLGYFGKRYTGTINEEREKQVFQRVNKHIKQSINTKNILLELGTVRNPKRRTKTTYYLVDASGTRELSIEELRNYLTQKQFEGETSEVSGRQYYTVNLEAITKVNGISW